MKLSICIATFKRPDRLNSLLGDLARQTLAPDEVVVVDNDVDGSAKPIVERLRTGGLPFDLHYDVQPERNIALTRNRTVAMSSGEWVAFVDDDERAPESWLQQLMDAAAQYHADGILAPVEPIVPADAPAWIRRGRFYDFPRLPSGGEVPLQRMRFGNVLLRGDLLRSEPGPFNPQYRLTTGEDADLLVRLVKKGARIIWSDEAIVYEPIERARLSLQWLLQRALSGGQEFARKTLTGSYGRVTSSVRLRLFAQALVQLLAAMGLALISLPLGRHRCAYWLTRAAANFGKLSTFWGWRYEEYEKVPT